MKNIKPLRIFLVFVFLSLLLVAAPAAPAQAERGITLSPNVGKIDERITITGTEFNKSTSTSDKYAAIYFSSDAASTLDDIGVEVTYYEMVKEGVWLDEDGDFETTFRVPDVLDDGTKEEEVTAGTYYVYVCHYVGTTVQTRIRAKATFTVTQGEISIYPQRETVGTLVEITGDGFAEDRRLTIKYDGYSVPVYSGNEQTDNGGEFNSVITIPESTAGAHTISATVAGDETEAIFTVEPEMLINPASGEPGTTVIVSGTGFGKLKPVDVWFHNTAVAAQTTNTLGSFYVDFDVPDLQPGRYNVDAEEGANLAKARFTITESSPPPSPQPPPAEPSPAVSISTTTANIGQGIVMGGSGFEAESTVTIKYDDELLTAVTTDGNGVFAAAFNVPPSKYGEHVINISDGIRTSELDFTVESTPPSVPTLVKPEMGAKVRAPVYFYWGDVTDPSPPVTYTLQVATNIDFSASAMILDEKGLTKTEYTINEAEMRALNLGEDIHYWRVRAIDGASNEGGWSNPKTLYFVTSAAIPTWAIITIAVIGGILLLALGFFIRSRIGGSR